MLGKEEQRRKGNGGGKARKIVRDREGRGSVGERGEAEKEAHKEIAPVSNHSVWT